MNARILGVFFVSLLAGSVTGDEPSRPVDVKTQINDARRDLKVLQDALSAWEKRYDREVVNPKLKDVDETISSLLGAKKSLEKMEDSAEKREDLKIIGIRLDHCRLARTKLDPNGGLAIDLLGGPNLSDTPLAKHLNERIQKLKTEIAKTEAKIKELEDSATSPDKSQKNRPANGRYQLTAGKLGDLATLEWTNHTDGSAEVKVSSPFFMLLMIDEPVFKARWDGQKSAYVVDGSDLQSFMKATAKPRAPDGPGWNARITDVQSNLSFVITTQGSNLVLKMGGSYHAKGFHERVVDGVTERKPTNTDFPSKEHQDIELIAKPLAQ